MPHRHLHLERVPTVPEILGDEHGGLFANQQGRAVRVAADVVGADGQVGAFEPAHPVHVEPRVQDAVFDDRVAGARGHGAGAETW